MIATITGTGTGAAPVVNITFPYIDKTHVKASVNGTEVGLVWTGTSQVTLTGTVASGLPWKVYRQTPTTPALVDFTDASVITESDLDLAETSHRYRDEELADLVELAEGVADGAISAAVAQEKSERVASDNAILASMTGVTFTEATLPAADRNLLSQLDHSTGTPAMLLEPGREGHFIPVSSDLSAKVAADPQQGLYVAFSSDPTGTSGAWVRSFNGPVNPTWFGIVEGDAGGGHAAGNNTAWSGLMETLGALAVNAQGNYRSLRKVEFGVGTFEFSQPLDITSGTVDIGGQGNGHINNGASTAATRLKFYNSTGIRIQSPDTSGSATKDGVAHMGATKTAIHDMALEGTFAGTEAEYHGIHARATFVRRNVTVYNFAGDGIRIEAETTTTGGNATDWYGENDYVIYCRNGIYDVGDNTSAGTNIGGTYNQNRAFGIYAANFLGSTWVGFETAGNGVTLYNDGAAIGASIVSYNGNRYGAILGQESGASVNAPSGTTADNAYWYFISAGGATTGRPTWSSGMLVRAGGAVADTNLSSKNTYLGGYAEQDQGKGQIWQRSLVIGGMFSQWVFQNPGANLGTPLITSDDGILNMSQSVAVQSGDVRVILGNVDGNAAKMVYQIYSPSNAPDMHRLKAVGGDLRHDYANSDSYVQYVITGPNTLLQFGKGMVAPHIFAPGKFALPYWSVGAPSNLSREMAMGAAPPTTGAHAQGEIIWNSAPVVGQPMGWVCTAAGTPGTWTAMAVL